jgi:hypothetical protein
MQSLKPSRFENLWCLVGFLALFGGGIAILGSAWPQTLLNPAAIRTAVAPFAVHAATVDPWTTSETVEPAKLVKELKTREERNRPVVVCVSPHVMYESDHIPGAIYDGPGSTEEGLSNLKNWARSMPRSANIVIYCGCCPLDHCPNIRPAFRTLKSMGFTHLRVLLLRTNFYTDWFAKGYPVEKGK